MHPKAKDALLDKIVAIAARATNDAVRPNEAWRSWEELGFPNTMIDPPAVADFQKIVERLASKPDWGDRFSEEYIDQRLGKVLLTAHRHGRSQAAALLDALVRDQQTLATEQTVIVPIAGLTLMMPGLKVGLVTIRKGVAPGVPADSNTARHLTGKVYAEFSVLAEPIKAGERATEETRRALEAIMFAHVAADPFGQASDAFVSLESEQVSPAAWVDVVSDAGIFTDYRRTQRSWPVLVSSGTLANLNAHGLGELSALLAKQPNDLSELEDALLRAVHWFGASQAQLEVENRLLNLTTCLEVLVGPLQPTEPIGSTMAEAVALIVGDRYDERAEIRSFVVAQYGARSRVSHGGRRSVSESDTRRVRALVIKLTIRLLASRGVIKDRKALFAWLERTRLSGPLASPGTMRTIGEIRADQGLSFMQLVHRLGCQPDAMDRWERFGPDLPALRLIANALEFPIERIALPANKILIDHRGHRFLLAARRQDDGSWVAKPEGWDPTDADDWPVRAVDSDHPHAVSPSIIVTANWTFRADSSDAALGGLERRINDAMARALTPTRLPDEAEDWQPPETPQHWIDHLATKARRGESGTPGRR